MCSQVSCSHGCLPKSIETKTGQKNAEELLEEIFKTSLAVENFYWYTHTRTHTHTYTHTYARTHTDTHGHTHTHTYTHA